jgi:hypothetical protein
MGSHVLILLDVVDNPQEALKELTIPAVIKTFQIILNLRELE